MKLKLEPKEGFKFVSRRMESAGNRNKKEIKKFVPDGRVHQISFSRILNPSEKINDFG
jgi:hypothetical protein